MSESFEAELAELVALTREHLRWEMDLGSRGLPEVSVEPRAEVEPSAEAPAPLAAPAAPLPPPTEARSPVVEPAAERSAPERSAPERSAPEQDVAQTTDPPADRRTRLALIEERVRGCVQCGLHAGRTQTVFARGNPAARLVFVGEGPGFNEDREGAPFVGKAGALLDRMIAAMGFGKDEVYICNVVKCRPPDNRTPNPDEIAACMPFLRSQLEIVQPEVIVALGRCAAETLGVATSGKPWRGAWGAWEGARVMPTYHPAYLLRSPEHKRPVWEDLQQVVVAMGRTLPAPRR